VSRHRAPCPQRFGPCSLRASRLLSLVQSWFTSKCVASCNSCNGFLCSRWLRRRACIRLGPQGRDSLRLQALMMWPRCFLPTSGNLQHRAWRCPAKAFGSARKLPRGPLAATECLAALAFEEESSLRSFSTPPRGVTRLNFRRTQEQRTPGAWLQVA
jgi:hypothetical protein